MTMCFATVWDDNDDEWEVRADVVKSGGPEPGWHVDQIEVRRIAPGVFETDSGWDSHEEYPHLFDKKTMDRVIEDLIDDAKDGL